MKENEKRLPPAAELPKRSLAEDGEEMVRDVEDRQDDEPLYTDVKTDHQLSMEVPIQQRPGGFNPTMQTLKEFSGGRYGATRMPNSGAAKFGYGRNK